MDFRDQLPDRFRIKRCEEIAFTDRISAFDIYFFDDDTFRNFQIFCITAGQRAVSDYRCTNAAP